MHKIKIHTGKTYISLKSKKLRVKKLRVNNTS